MVTVNKKGKKLVVSKNTVDEVYQPTQALTNFKANNYTYNRTSVQLDGGKLAGYHFQYELKLTFPSNFFIASDGLRYTSNMPAAGTCKLYINGVLINDMLPQGTDVQVVDLINTALLKQQYDSSIVLYLDYIQDVNFANRLFELSVKGFWF